MTAENRFFLWAVYAGVYTAFLYDLLRIFRGAVTHKKGWVAIEDLGFWVYVAVFGLKGMHRLSDGTLRWFAVLGALLGICCYRKLTGPYLLKWGTKGLSLLLRPVKAVKGWLKNRLKNCRKMLRIKWNRYTARVRTFKKGTQGVDVNGEHNAGKKDQKKSCIS